MMSYRELFNKILKYMQDFNAMVKIPLNKAAQKLKWQDDKHQVLKIEPLYFKHSLPST